jgi:hypothetical protein
VSWRHVVTGLRFPRFVYFDHHTNRLHREDRKCHILVDTLLSLMIISTVRPVQWPVVWEDYLEIETWVPSWLTDFEKSRGVLVNTTDYDPDSVFELMYEQISPHMACP